MQSVAGAGVVVTGGGSGIGAALARRFAAAGARVVVNDLNGAAAAQVARSCGGTAAPGDAAVLAAQECVQLHGGIGFTWEHPAHLLLKRAKSGSLALGTPDRHRAVLATLADLPPPPPG